jgi:hypothetical protein
VVKEGRMIKFRNADSFAVIEPRIMHVKNELTRLLALVELEQGGRPVEVDGFRLKDLSAWQSYTTNTAMNALTPISGYCNSRCHFCFEENIPYAREKSIMPMAEARTRLKYYDPTSGASLFPSNRPHMETFVHPQALEIIELARQREPDRLFWITTNGSHFTEETVERLARLKPLIFKLSLNVADPALNRALMGTGRKTEVAIRAPELLQRHRIPFMGSIVAWPTQTEEALEATVRYLERHQAYAVRIRLPLTHQWLKTQLSDDFHRHWERIAAFAHDLRKRVTVALFVEPPIYWVNPIIPEVDGVVLNSPAYRAGIRPGDVIESINGRPILTRIESEAMLDQCHLAGEAVDLVVRREDGSRAFRLVDPPSTEDTYPYNARYFYRGENYGIFHVEDFRLRYIQQLFETIDRYQARRVMLFSSAIVAPVFETLVNNIPEFSARLEDITLYIETVKHNTAGGNYDVMDSRFVEDYARVIRRRLAQGVRPDLILIPDAFGSPWGMDLGAQSYSRLAMEFGIPVELIEWLLVYGREV